MVLERQHASCLIVCTPGTSTQAHPPPATAVRGAYMVLERQRAREMGYPSPIHETKDDTHANYNA